MKTFTFFLAGVIMMPMSHMAQVDVNKQLGSGRNDLWVLSKRDPTDRSVEIQLRLWKLPLNLWGKDNGGWDSSPILYAERPRDGDWNQIAPYNIFMNEQIHLSKYDERSAFSLKWGPDFGDGETFQRAGTILRFEDGHLKLIPNARKQARMDYGLNESQEFMGMVGNKVFYFDATQCGKIDKIFFFEKGHPDQRFEIIIPLRRWWPRSWRLRRAEQVFAGDNPDEIQVFVWVKNTAWIAVARVDLGGITLDMKTAKPVSNGAK